MRGGRLLCWAALAAAGWAVQACGDGGQGVGVPGTAVVSLTSPVTDGAILLRLTGPGFTGAPVAAGSSMKLYWRQVSEGEIVVAAFGTIGGGALVQVEIPDTREVARYAGTVLDAADRSDTQRTDLGTYAIQVAVAK